MSIRLPVTVSCVALAATLFCVPCVAVSPAVAQEAACAPITAVETPPPPLPIYEQPPVPGPGYLWSPGYWSWDEDQGDYYWVPGTWAQPPRPGLLWTPGYWGWLAGAYIFHPGYWGERVGFYGGVNYGFGYTGAGYEGGRWDHGVFAYNRAVNNLQGTTIRNVYEKNVVVNQTINNISYNGGRGGTEARPTALPTGPLPNSRTSRRHLCSASTSRWQARIRNSSRRPTAGCRQSAQRRVPATCGGRVSFGRGPSAKSYPQMVHGRRAKS